MGAQNLALALFIRLEEEGVVHLAGRMAFREIQRSEVIIIGLDIRAFCNRETHVGEDGGDLVDDLADRMDTATLGRRRADRQRDVQRFGLQARVDRSVLQDRLALRDCVGDLVLQRVDCRTAGLALFRRH
ncbi:hypothetical protein D3C80_1747240 [compost metagenome]